MPITFLAKFFIKIVVGFNWLKTIWIFRGQDDPTDILVRLQTIEQVNAAESVKENSTILSHSNLIILLPYRDKFDLTEMCLKSLLQQDLKDIKVELVLIDNGSIESQTHQGVNNIVDVLQQSGIQTKILNCDYPFNFSRLINDGYAASCRNGYILLLNNDIEFLERNTLRSLISFMQANPNAGCVGSTLVFPSGLIQHLFLAPGVKTVGAHPGKGWKLDLTHKWYNSPRPVAATTGALLLVKSEDYEAVDGVDENFSTNFQDLDFCLKILKLGRVNWVLPKVVAKHHESATRKSSPPSEEILRMYSKWGDYLNYNPLYSEYFSRWSEVPLIRTFDRKYPIRLVTSPSKKISD